MEVGKRITMFREKKGITINKLANLAGISQSYLREVEMEKKKPTVEIVSLLCDALEISLRDFFDDASVSLLEKDELNSIIFQLSADQRKKLTEFLKTII